MNSLKEKPSGPFKNGTVAEAYNACSAKDQAPKSPVGSESGESVHSTGTAFNAKDEQFKREAEQYDMKKVLEELKNPWHARYWNPRRLVLEIKTLWKAGKLVRSSDLKETSSKDIPPTKDTSIAKGPEVLVQVKTEKNQYDEFYKELRTEAAIQNILLDNCEEKLRKACDPNAKAQAIAEGEEIPDDNVCRFDVENLYELFNEYWYYIFSEYISMILVRLGANFVGNEEDIEIASKKAAAIQRLAEKQKERYANHCAKSA